ncbi:CoA-disulfide reductase [Mesoplasma photuris]|uniref:CoA-disulfide reductase n=1 Tax=Mesoplasma photuris TaxID=217731 RepID=UPI0004E12525|nr:CoA-disulfide reductase [Mesoplasma photuris]
MKVVIVGGAAAGMGMAAKLKRLKPDTEIVVYQKNDYVSLGACGLPYFVADNFQDPNQLIARQVTEFEKTGIIINTGTTVDNIDFESKKLYFKDKKGNSGEDSYDEIMIATGASPIVIPVPGIQSKNVFTLTSLEDGIRLKEAVINNNKINNIAVIGAGFIGLEVVETLKHLNKNVTLIEMEQRVLAKTFDEDLTNIFEEELYSNKVEFIKGDALIEVIEEKGKVVSIKLKSGKVLDCDAVVLSVGFRPNTAFLKESGIKMLGNGAIIVNDQGKTNIDHVWSVGDCASSKNYLDGSDTYTPLATVANKFAKVVANNIAGVESKFSGTLGTAIIRVFNKEGARVGFTEEYAKAKGIDYSVSIVHDKDHTNYVPNQAPLSIKLIMDNKTKTIIGGQIIGSDKAVLRIHSIIAMIWSKIKVNEALEQIDMPYAPPFARTTDIVNIALSKFVK